MNHTKNQAAQRRLRITRFMLSVVWLTIFVGTHVPMEPAPSTTHWDKLVHFTAYGVLAFLMAYYRGQLGSMTRRAYLIIFAIAAVYGVFDELTQLLVHGRSADPLDWCADLAGALVGLTVYWRYGRKSEEPFTRNHS